MNRLLTTTVNSLKTAWYILTTVPFVLWCVCWNLGGLALSMNIGTPVLFFDMTGTAIASLSRGLGYGVFVALLSNLIPAFVVQLAPGSSEYLGLDTSIYAWFGFTNAMGAVVWATVPRIIVHVQNRRGSRFGFLSTNPNVGYRTLLNQIVIVGILAGAAVTIHGLFTQALALGCSPGAGVQACTEGNPAVATSVLLLKLSRADDWTFGAAYYLVLLVFNIPDKIVATASAMVLMFTFHRVPNYAVQRRQLRHFRHEAAQEPRSFAIATTLYIVTIIGFGVAYFDLLFETRPLDLGASVAFFGSLALLAQFLFRPLGMPLHSVFYRKLDPSSDIYHPSDLIGLQSVHRDVFEDLLKTVLLFVMVVNLGLERLQQADAAAVPLGSIETLAAPIILLTLWRYFIVFLARYKGSLYARPAAATSAATKSAPFDGPAPAAAPS